MSPGHLAYVEWFTRPTAASKDVDSGMYVVSRSQTQGCRHAAIIEVDTILRTCQLVPKFGQRANRVWTPHNVLELCSTFFVNNFVNHLTYQIIY